MRHHRLFTWLAALTACTALASCGGSDADEPHDDGANAQSRIYLLASQQAQLTPATSANGEATWTLTLQQAKADAMWYTDRPARSTGTTPLREYVGATWAQVYGQTPPNATLQFQQQGSSKLDIVYGSLSQPSYNADAGSVTFQLSLLNQSLAQMPDSTLNATDVTLNVLNNAADGKEVSSYIQYAHQAALEPTTGNQYKLVMRNAGPDMLWVDNAPGVYSDSRPMSHFFPQWPYLFRDSPPNAALFGTMANGTRKLYLVTLTEPVYDTAAGNVSYTATLLSNAGAPEPLERVVLTIDSGAFSRFPMPGKGSAYQGFSKGYDPSTANTSYIYFGSDIARKQTGSLWGTQSHLSESCAPYCRDDLRTMKDMGINLIRLYDWDPRNDHSQFLDYADSLNIKVVVPISNWLPTQGPSTWDAQVPGYFTSRNYGNKAGTDWHPAIAGIIISNELDAPDHTGTVYYPNTVGLVARFLQEIDKRGFSKKVPVGIPVTFVPRGAPFGPGGRNMPGWNQFNLLLTDPRTAPYKDQLMLAPNTYNDRNYLFTDAEGTGQGWVPLTYQQFGVPILFTEIGYSRSNPDYSNDYVRNQLQGVLEYQKAHPEQLLGAMHFQFENKVWKQTPGDTDSEGAFGTLRHGDIVKRIQTVQKDYDFYIDEAKTNYGILDIGSLEPTVTHQAVVDAYKD